VFSSSLPLFGEEKGKKNLNFDSLSLYIYFIYSPLIIVSSSLSVYEKHWKNPNS
jgi:hypothetical protein